MIKLKNISIIILEQTEHLTTQTLFRESNTILQRTKNDTLKVIKDRTGKFFIFK